MSRPYCCVVNLYYTITRGLTSRRDKAMALGEYVDSIPGKLFQLRDRDLAEICEAKRITAKERAELLRELLSILDDE